MGSLDSVVRKIINKIFYIEERIGKDGKPFEMRKFRTMPYRPDRDEAFERKYVFNDEEYKKLPLYAKILRSTGMDELPQLYNLFKGEMALVGPRAQTRGESERNFDEPLKTERVRGIKPGIANLWHASEKPITRETIPEKEWPFIEMVRKGIMYNILAQFYFGSRIIYNIGTGKQRLR